MTESVAFEKTIEYLTQDSLTRERIGDFQGYENKIGGELSTSKAKFYIRIFGSKDTIVTKVVLTKNETEWQIIDLEL
ncbi:hypothetical protein KDU71_22565 [Carboxylicivirga sediminis]|uniref:Uncharacterized protein n=1 Tax=Carboxylicivirga sediminis TaxID=2006564 RepID=A0A941F864_9BACT|nr:hypothetical protein [Carboxylicivirga sediminis]MBR8538372.1 hypothetical protein [Carboxylicivirga sediminis]